MRNAPPSNVSIGSGLLAVAADTPASRDRYADFLRAFSILVVVFGHWLIAVVTWRDGKIDGANALELIDGVWVLTWLLQVMPLFFFIGGFSNLRSWKATKRRGDGYAPFLYSRMLRMMRPVAVFLVIGLFVITILDAANFADNAVFPTSELIARPLWFLGVYMIVVALAPVMIRLHNHYGAKVLFAMAVVAVVTDAIRFGFDVTAVGYINYPVIWLMAHQFGFFYADGVLPRVGIWLASSGLLGLLLLVNLGPYPGSMVGLSRDEFSNMDPPTVSIAALSVFQVGLCLLLRAPLSRWLERLRVWASVIYVNSVIMTVFLWHLAAMLFGIGLLFPFGFPQPVVGTREWWALRPIWVALLLVILALLVMTFGRFEARGLTRKLRPPPSHDLPRVANAQAALGTALLVLGILGFAMGGMHQLFSSTGTELIVFNLNPALSMIHLALGWMLLRGTAGDRRDLIGMSFGSLVGLVILGVFGLLDLAGSVSDPFALNSADTMFHFSAALFSGFVLLCALRGSTDEINASLQIQGSLDEVDGLLNSSTDSSSGGNR